MGREEVVTLSSAGSSWRSGKRYLLHRAEHRFYVQHSQAIRRVRSRKRKPIVVITEEGEFLMPCKLPR